MPTTPLTRPTLKRPFPDWYQRFQLEPRPWNGKPLTPLELAERCAFAQELHAAGVDQVGVCHALHCSTQSVGRYRNPERLPDAVFPLPWLVLEDSPVDGGFVLYDAWAQPTRNQTEIMVHLAAVHLEADGKLETVHDVPSRTTVFQAAGDVPDMEALLQLMSEAMDELAAGDGVGLSEQAFAACGG